MHVRTQVHTQLHVLCTQVQTQLHVLCTQVQTYCAYAATYAAPRTVHAGTDILCTHVHTYCARRYRRSYISRFQIRV